jgi:cobalamin-dependent methionine synthase I
MNDTKNQTRKPLPESVMKAIRLVLSGEGDMSEAERFEAVLLLVHGYGLVAQADTVDPTRFAIPNEQWTEVSERLIDMADQASGLSRVNAALAWMNSGPSAYDPNAGQ